MGENNPQEVQFGNQPPKNAEVQFGKVPPSPSVEVGTDYTPGATVDHDTGIVPESAGGDPVPDDAVSDAADDGSGADSEG